MAELTGITLEKFPYIADESVQNLDKAAENVVKLLISRNLRLSTAESCTGGLISGLITSVSGASDVFEMGLCAYANRIKNEFLGVPEDELIKYSAVSSQTAIWMAKGIREKSGSDISVSVTGIAGPTGGTPEKPVGTVYVGYADSKGAESLKLDGLLLLQNKSRENIRLHTAAAVMRLLEEKLRKRI